MIADNDQEYSLWESIFPTVLSAIWLIEFDKVCFMIKQRQGFTTCMLWCTLKKNSRRLLLGTF